MRDITDEVRIMMSAFGWDDGGVFVRVMYKNKKIGKLYLADRIEFDPPFFGQQRFIYRRKDDGSRRIYDREEE